MLRGPRHDQQRRMTPRISARLLPTKLLLPSAHLSCNIRYEKSILKHIYTIFMTSTNQGPRRLGQYLYLKPDRIEEYKKCHAAVWPEVLKQIESSNIRDCALFPISSSHLFHLKRTFFLCIFSDSIFLSLLPRPTLFASFKYVGNSFDEDMARMAANPKVQEWWRMTDGMQQSPVDGAVGSKDGPGWWGVMEEVFHVE
jgi:L-rhamnose mutarotase